MNGPVLARILVVDDDEQFRGFFVAALEQHGYGAVTASGGEEALALLDERGADVVFCDVYMPGLNGLQTIERIAGRPDPPKIVLMSGAHNRDATLEGAAFRYADIRTLDKPFYLDALLDLLDELVGDAAAPDEPPSP